MSAAARSWIDAAERAAAAAAAAVRPWFRTRLSATLKPDQSPVTLADQAAERAIRATLAHAFPDHGRWGEEEGLENAGAGLRWVFDPIDGTRAFLTGRPSFCTLIALLEDEIPILGLIDQPITGERWLGVAGEATRFTGGAGRPATRRGIALQDAELSATAPEIFPASARQGFHALSGRVRRTSWGGDAYAYGLLALGQIDIIAEATLQPWDWAALVPVIEGAGGCIGDWQGRKLRLEGDGRVLALGDPALRASVAAVLQAS